MSQRLARRNDGCFECCKRRIKCDKTEPDCVKCQKKGIQCSGQGLRCKISTHMDMSIKSGRARRKRAPLSSTSRISSLSPILLDTSTLRSQEMIVSHDSREAYLRVQQRKNLASSEGHEIAYESFTLRDRVIYPEFPAEPTKTLLCGKALDQGARDQLLSTSLMPLRAALNEPIHPQARQFMSHFCDNIAPMMVVLDFAGNGYRDVILPMAMHDETLMKAVSVVSAFHISQKAPHMQEKALQNHQAIVKRLRQDSLVLPPEKLFTPYTLATIIILLVGETITGADNHVYLLKMLSCMSESMEAMTALPNSLREFLAQQIKMFKLFGCPLSDEASGLRILKKAPDHYMDFISYPTLPVDSAHQVTIQIMRDAIRDACELYRRRALSTSTSSEDSASLVEWLRSRVLPLQATTKGSHALVWTYFIAAAESITIEHRDFFTSRLRELHRITGFGSIPVALDNLESIWAMQGSKKWTEIDIPILVM